MKQTSIFTILLVIFCSIAMVQNSFLKVKRNSKIFDNVFKFQEGEVEIINTTNTKNITKFIGEIAWDDNGVYFKKKNSKVDIDYSKFSYTDSNKNATVIDFALIVGCEFNATQKKGLKFKFRTFQGNGQKKEYELKIQYNFWSRLFGESKTSKNIDSLGIKCKNRQKEIALKALETEKLNAKKLEEVKVLIEHAKEQFDSFINQAKENAAKVKDVFKDIASGIDKFIKEQKSALDTKAKTQIEASINKVKKQVENGNIENLPSLPNEKEFITRLKKIEVNQDAGYGLGFFISGNKPYLGEWKNMHPLTIHGDTNWTFSSSELTDGDEFKIIKSYYSNQVVDLNGKYQLKDSTIDVNAKNIAPNVIIFEKPEGKEGNQKVKLTKDVMIHEPKFNS